MNDDEIKAEEKACHDNLKAQIVGVLYLAHRRNIPYLAAWDIAPQCDLDPEVRPFGGCGVPGEGDDALKSLVKDGMIEELSDLRCRYRLVAQRQTEERLTALEAAEASHHQALATMEAMLADCQQQATALARQDAWPSAADMILLRETVQALRAIGRRPKLAGQVDALLGRLEAAGSEASDGSR